MNIRFLPACRYLSSTTQTVWSSLQMRIEFINWCLILVALLSFSVELQWLSVKKQENKFQGISAPSVLGQRRRTLSSSVSAFLIQLSPPSFEPLVILFSRALALILSAQLCSVVPVLPPAFLEIIRVTFTRFAADITLIYSPHIDLKTTTVQKGTGWSLANWWRLFPCMPNFNWGWQITPCSF